MVLTRARSSRSKRVSDSLRREMAPFGVGVVVVEPGAVRTEMPGRAIATAHELASAMTPEQSQRYGALVQAVTAHTTSGSGLPADAAAKVIAKAIAVRKPHIRYTVGCDAALITLLARIHGEDLRCIHRDNCGRVELSTRDHADSRPMRRSSL